MIKRRFYKLEHGDRDAPSESSSSSDSELEAEATEESEEEEKDNDGEEGDEEEEGNDNEDKVKVRQNNQSFSSSSGYESEDSSANDVNLDSSGLPTSDDDTGTQHDKRGAMEGHASGAGNAESIDIQHKDGDLPSDLADCAVKCKSVYKCRLCPRIVCLTEETLQAHLKSKRHARSAKLLREGRLKLMLNDDGKVEGETPQEKQAFAEEHSTFSTNKKCKRRYRSSKRWLKKKKGGRAKFSRKDLAKKIRINGN